MGQLKTQGAAAVGLRPNGSGVIEVATNLGHGVSIDELAGFPGVSATHKVKAEIVAEPGEGLHERPIRPGLDTGRNKRKVPTSQSPAEFFVIAQQIGEAVDENLRGRGVGIAIYGRSDDSQWCGGDPIDYIRTDQPSLQWSNPLLRSVRQCSWRIVPSSCD